MKLLYGDFYNNINNGMKYLCDKCNVSILRYDEFTNNSKKEFRYCDECFTWLHLQTWKDDKGNVYTIRSERKINENN